MRRISWPRRSQPGSAGEALLDLRLGQKGHGSSSDRVRPVRPERRAPRAGAAAATAAAATLGRRPRFARRSAPGARLRRRLVVAPGIGRAELRPLRGELASLLAAVDLQPAHRLLEVALADHRAPRRAGDSGTSRRRRWASRMSRSRSRSRRAKGSESGPAGPGRRPAASSSSSAPSAATSAATSSRGGSGSAGSPVRARRGGGAARGHAPQRHAERHQERAHEERVRQLVGAGEARLAVRVEPRRASRGAPSFPAAIARSASGRR